MASLLDEIRGSDRTWSPYCHRDSVALHCCDGLACDLDQEIEIFRSRILLFVDEGVIRIELILTRCDPELLALNIRDIRYCDAGSRKFLHGFRDPIRT